MINIYEHFQCWLILILFLYLILIFSVFFKLELQVIWKIVSQISKKRDQNFVNLTNVFTFTDWFLELIKIRNRRTFRKQPLNNMLFKMFYTFKFIYIVNSAYGSQLSHILYKPSITVFLMWYAKYITWYSRYISSNVTFTLCEKLGTLITNSLR